MAYTKTGRGGEGLTKAGQSGYDKTQATWRSLIFGALAERGVDIDNSSMAEDLYAFIIDRVFTNNFYEGGDIGFSTIDSYVGLLQATNQLPGVVKYGGPLLHFNELKLANQRKVDAFNGFNSTSSSNNGLSLVPSRHGWR